MLRLHGAAGSAWRASGGHCSGCDRVVAPVRPPFSLSPARLALWAGVSLGALVMFGGVVLWLALRNYRAVCPNCSLGVSLGALATFSGVVLWPALGFILWRNCGAVCPDCGHGPMGGNVGWTRESFILWAGVVACFLAALWGTFHLALLLALLFTW